MEYLVPFILRSGTQGYKISDKLSAHLEVEARIYLEREFNVKRKMPASYMCTQCIKKVKQSHYRPEQAHKGPTRSRLPDF
jgi:hypothetical protein